MDHLRICMDALRRTASDAEGMRVHLGEQWIDQFCKAQSGNQKGPLKLLLNAIHNQAEQHPTGRLLDHDGGIRSGEASWPGA